MGQPRYPGSGQGEEPGRDRRLGWFASGGRFDKVRPTAKMGSAVEAVTGAGSRPPSAATDDEVTGIMVCWQALGAHAEAGMLAAVREIIRRRAPRVKNGKAKTPVTIYPGDLPAEWGIGVAHEVAAALAISWQSADALVSFAFELEARLPGVGRLLDDGVITALKARIIVQELSLLSDEKIAEAEKLLLEYDFRSATMTPGKIRQLCQRLADTVDPKGSRKRRQQAEREDARVRFFRSHGGAGSLFASGLPADEALMSESNIQKRALEYQAVGIDEKMDLLRVLALLDSINGRTLDDRVALWCAEHSGDDGLDCGGTGGRGGSGRGSGGRSGSGGGPSSGSGGAGWGGDDHGGGGGGGRGWNGGGSGDEVGGPSKGGDCGGRGRASAAEGTAGPSGDGGPGGGGDSGGGRGGLSESGGDPGGGGGRDPGRDDGRSDGSPGDHGKHGRGSDGGLRVGRPDSGLPSLVNLTLPLADLLDRREQRPGEAPGYGSIDPDLVRQLAEAAIRSRRSKFCITLTDQHGHAAAHGCARLIRSSDGPGGGRDGPASGGWGLSPDGNRPGPAGGLGAWILSMPGGRRYRVNLHAIPLHSCDHSYETDGYRPSAVLRHLVQVRDGVCTFPGCSRPARESDFEHAVPYDKGGRTDFCNAGARSRRCHRVKQSPGWTVTQPEPGWHKWTVPSGRSYVKGPKQYPA